jgi:hypothetical protein
MNRTNNLAGRTIMKLITLLVISMSMTLALKPRPANLEPKLTQLVSVNVNLEQSQIFYNGMPAYVPFTITNTQKESVQIPEWNAFEASVPISIELTDPNGKKYSSTVNRYAFILGELETNRGPRPVFKKKITFNSNESIRCLSNIGFAIEKINVPSGKYRMRICIWEDLDKIAGRSEEQMIQIADLKAEDKKWLSENFEVLSWGVNKIKRTITPSTIKSIPTKELREQLAFNVILNILASPKNLADTKISGYENLVAPYLSDDIELFKYEILLAKKDNRNAEQVKQSLTTKGHSMDYWLKQAEDGKGYIKILKSNSDDSIEKNARLIDANSPD